MPGTVPEYLEASKTFLGFLVGRLVCGTRLRLLAFPTRVARACGLVALIGGCFFLAIALRSYTISR